VTPERRNYAHKRIVRLTAILRRINDLIAARNHSGHPDDVRAREQLMKQRNSTVASIKRWEKKLAEPN